MNKIIAFVLGFLLVSCVQSPFVHASGNIDNMINQFDGYTVNGVTAREVAEPVIRAEEQARVQGVDARSEEYNRLANEYNSISTQERECRNIVAQHSDPYLYSNPHDFIKGAGTYTHWLTDGNIELMCEHDNLEDLEYHADLFEKKVDLWSQAINAKQKIKEEESKTSSVGTTYNRVRAALQPFYDLKKEKMQWKVSEKNAEIKRITCNAIIPMYVENGIAHTAHECKGICEIVVSEDKNGILDYSCYCGHPLSEHTIKYKEKKETKTVSEKNMINSNETKTQVGAMQEAITCIRENPKIRKVSGGGAIGYFMIMKVKIKNISPKNIAAIDGYMIPFDNRGNRYAPAKMKTITNIKPGKEKEGDSFFNLAGNDKRWIVEAVYRTLNCDNILGYDMVIKSVLFDDGELLTH